MKIVFEHQSNATRNRQQMSLARELVRIGHTCVTWHSDNVCWFDMLYEQKPDRVVISNKTSHTKDVAQCVSNLCIFRYVQHNDSTIELMSDGSTFPIDGFDERLCEGGEYNELYAADNLIITSGIDTKHVPAILTLATGQPNTKIFGSTPVNSPCFCGNVPSSEIKHIFASAKNYYHFYEHPNDLLWMAHHYHVIVHGAFSKMNLQNVKTYAQLALDFERII